MNKRKRANADSTNGKRDKREKICTEPRSVSKYFSNPSDECDNSISSRLLNVARELNSGLEGLQFSTPRYIYNPTVYAFEPFKNYTEKYGNSEKTILFVGMNPGPFGMSQTGVPFGEIDAVKNFLNIRGEVKKPPEESPNRPVKGFDCERSEVSGKRLWDLAKTLCDTSENFFRHCFIYNYCPLQFIDKKGANVTPADLKNHERDALFQICDGSLLEVIKIMNCKIVVGIGTFAEKRLQKVLNGKVTIKILSIPHPSPRAANNQDWKNKTIKRMETLDLLQYFTK